MAYDFSSVNNKKITIIDWLKHEYKSIQTGRATPIVLDSVYIDLYGSRTLVAHTGSITIEDTKTLRVTPWDKSTVSAIEKAINEANLGLSVASDSDGLRVHFPLLTTETRQRLVKTLKDKLEDARIRVRQLREEVNKDIDAKEKEGEFGEDEKKRYRDEMQSVVDGANQELETIFQSKEKEVMGE
jgi:ribosome recycling factor